MNQPNRLCDRAALLHQRRRATEMFLQEHAADDVQERLKEVNRSFTKPAIVTGFPEFWSDRFPNAQIVHDSEVLPLESGQHDLVIHALSLHWADDPVGQLIQCRRALKPDGLFLATLFAGQTLHELRSVLAQAEITTTGGLSPRILPMSDIKDLGGLLQRAGFALPVADTLTIPVSYRSPHHLMRDLRGMGETNAMAQRLRHPTRRAVFTLMARLYETEFDTDGQIPATFEIATLTGWAPSADQPQPLRPGTARQRLADALGATEAPLDPSDD